MPNAQSNICVFCNPKWYMDFWYKLHNQASTKRGKTLGLKYFLAILYNFIYRCGYFQQLDIHTLVIRNYSHFRNLQLFASPILLLHHRQGLLQYMCNVITFYFLPHKITSNYFLHRKFLTAHAIQLLRNNIWVA